MLATRRQRFLERYPGPAVFGSGLARIRNFEGNRFPFRAESHFLYFVGRHLEGALLCFEAGEARLYLPELDRAAALWHAQPDIERLSEELALPIHRLDDFAAPDGVATIAPDDTESSLWLEQCLGRAVEPGSASELEGTDLELARAMIDVRLCHDELAIEHIERAVEVSVRAHLAGMRATRGAQREAEVRAAMEQVMTAHSMGPAYTSIVTTRGEILHCETSTLPLEPGSLLLADVGAEEPGGWASDITRTWPTGGRFTTLQKELYGVVLKAQRRACSELRPGVRFLDVHRAAASELVEGLLGVGLLRGSRDSLVEQGAASLFFPHGIGHLLGLDVHDMEDLGDLAGYAPGRTRSDEPAERYLRLDRDLSPGMVVTIEPGFYTAPSILDDPERVGSLRSAIAGRLLERVRAEVRGIRIEDDVLITSDGHRVLSAACPKSAEDIEACLAD